MSDQQIVPGPWPMLVYVDPMGAGGTMIVLSDEAFDFTDHVMTWQRRAMIRVMCERMLAQLDGVEPRCPG